jgi:late competence protein required for DNA uptake (superfamily II DNA/RNA helicase)
MTLQNQSKILDKYEEQYNSGSIQQFEILKGLPFYNWQANNNNNNNVYDFNHAIGLPQKNGIAMPLFDYEQMLYDTLQSNKHIWIKKATGLGVTEFILRYMAWLCLKHNTLSGSQMCIVVGPNIEKAIELIKRLKDLFLPKLGVTFDTKETVIELNGVHIEAYPSHHIDAMRSLTSPRFILIDEGDFFPPGQQQDARDVSERYIAKSNPWIVMVSTPNAPDGLFDRIEREPIDKCLYKRVLIILTAWVVFIQRMR